jgi:hypothetical protein
MMRRRNPAAMTDTPAFKRWFGQSKVVDERGEPRVMYHGTYEDFDVFDRFFMRSRGRESLDQVGSWFSSVPGKSGAGMYVSDTAEGAKIVPVYLSIQHPWSVTFKGMWRAAQRMSGQDENARPNAASVQALDDWMDAVGIDGIHIRPDERNGAEFAGQDVWIARHPTQIKSAIGNRGTFDPNDPRITHNPRRRVRTATRRNPKMEEYPCSRCGGTGRLSGYGHVWGGVCFKCHGTGTQTAKPSTKAAKWAVHFPKTVELPTSIDQGDDFVYIVSAKSPDQAVLKATTTFLGSRIRHEFTERGAWAEPYEEYMARFYAE